MSKHTRGPWYAFPFSDGDGWTIATEPSAHRVDVAETEEGKGDTTVCGIWKMSLETKANASLIASAPDLLAAAKKAEKLIRNGGVVPVRGMAWAALAAAIAKAEGRNV